jgi:2-oxoglutarate ferredoxin oxidoreductase subunit alpha
MKSDDDVFTVGIGGAAGDGVREAGQTIGALLAELGYEVYVSFTYPSVIRGGHNFSRISFSKNKVWADHDELDLLISLNEETTRLHINELSDSAVVFADSFEPDDISKLSDRAVVVPMKTSVRETEFPEIMRNSVALGAFCYLLDLPLENIISRLKRVFQTKRPEENIKLAEIGYEHLKNIDFRHTKKIERDDSEKTLVEGNIALAKGFLSAGLEFYFGYPMTPSTSILHYLASCQNESPVKVIQPENEIAVINMALGTAYAGKRTAIGSATGGFMLMQESFSFAGMAELPLVIAVSQRQAPATGVPTYSSQTDLQSVIHSGHGEFPRIVLLPGDQKEAFELGREALNMAWEYQTPVVVLLDKILSEHSATADLNTQKTVQNALVTAEFSGDYMRYKVTDDGISPLAFPGTPNAIVKVTSYEHDELGITADEKEPVKKMLDKRFAKRKTIETDIESFETIKIYGDPKSSTSIIFWGSTKGPVLEAAKYMKKIPRFVQILCAEPFPAEKLKTALSGSEKIINIEQNRDAQMAALIRQKAGIEVNKNILKYDSRPFDVLELAKLISNIQ